MHAPDRYLCAVWCFSAEVMYLIVRRIYSALWLLTWCPVLSRKWYLNYAPCGEEGINSYIAAANSISTHSPRVSYTHQTDCEHGTDPYAIAV